jgi:hypothetical protein
LALDHQKVIAKRDRRKRRLESTAGTDNFEVTVSFENEEQTWLTK